MSYVDLGVTFADAAGLPVVKDYQAYFAANANVIGIWRSDIADLLTMVDSRAASIANWLPDGPAMTQATATKQATLAYDATLGRNVFRFIRADATNYVQDGGTAIFAANQWSLIAIVKPSSYSALGVIATVGTGAFISANPGPLFQAQAGGTAAQTPADPAGWNVHTGTHPGANSARIKVGFQPVVTASSGSNPTGSGLLMGNNSSVVDFDGDIVMLMAINATDVLADLDTELWRNIEGFVATFGV